jgi:hypothetical protein
MRADRSALIGLMMSGVLGMAGSSPSFAADALLLVKRLNITQGRVSVDVKVDGKKFSDEECALERSADSICEGPITPGVHTVEVQIKGSPRVAKTINVRVQDAAMNWALVPKGLRLWCLLVTASDVKLASKAECWKIEDDK